MHADPPTHAVVIAGGGPTGLMLAPGVAGFAPGDRIAYTTTSIDRNSSSTAPGTRLGSARSSRCRSGCCAR